MSSSPVTTGPESFQSINVSVLPNCHREYILNLPIDFGVFDYSSIDVTTRMTFRLSFTKFKHNTTKHYKLGIIIKIIDCGNNCVNFMFICSCIQTTFGLEPFMLRPQLTYLHARPEEGKLCLTISLNSSLSWAFAAFILAKTMWD